MTGLIPFAGAERPNYRSHVLTEDQRAEMLRLYARGEKSTVLAERYGVHDAYVRKAAIRAGIRRRGAA